MKIARSGIKKKEEEGTRQTWACSSVKIDSESRVFAWFQGSLFWFSVGTKSSLLSAVAFSFPNSSKPSERLVHSCHSSCVLVLTLMWPILSALPYHQAPIAAQTSAESNTLTSYRKGLMLWPISLNRTDWVLLLHFQHFPVHARVAHGRYRAAV